MTVSLLPFFYEKVILVSYINRQHSLSFLTCPGFSPEEGCSEGRVLRCGGWAGAGFGSAGWWPVAVRKQPQVARSPQLAPRTSP